jgi:hypothetical protein
VQFGAGSYTSSPALRPDLSKCRQRIERLLPANLHRRSASNTVSIELQILWLFVLAIPIACIAWTITHEALFREVQEYCRTQSDTGTTIWRRKFFYLLTCEYCVSHYVTVVFLAVTRFHLLYQDWRGYLVSLFALVWVANQYMSIYNPVAPGH